MLQEIQRQPVKGAALYDRYIDEWLIAESEGVEIMLNEHHQTATCVDLSLIHI